MRFFDFFFGRYLLCTKAKNSTKLVNICLSSEIDYKEPCFTCDGFSIVCSYAGAKKLLYACKDRGVELCCSHSFGLPMLLTKYKNRWGLLVGCFLAIAMLCVGLDVVWRVDVSGNSELNKYEVEEILKENGFGVGTRISNADINFIENKVMRENKNIAWISVNMRGTVADVEVKEVKRGEKKQTSPAHLTSRADGIIERIESYNGNVAVKVGDEVKAGDILVSGIYENEQGDIRLTRAEGGVYARTKRELVIEIPYENTQKQETGLVKYEFYINFFKKSIKVFTNTGKIPSICDIIYKNSNMGVVGFPQIPIGYTKKEYREYEYASVTLSEQQAMELAFAQLENALDELSDDIELISKSINFNVGEKSYTLICSLECIENIAQTTEITGY